MFFNFALIFGLLDGEWDHAKMVMIVAIGLSYFEDSPEEYEPTKRELICFKKMYILQYWLVHHCLFWYVHHFQNGDGLESIILECPTTVLFTLNLLEMPFYFLYSVHDDEFILLCLQKTLSKLFTSWVAFVVNGECMGVNRGDTLPESTYHKISSH